VRAYFDGLCYPVNPGGYACGGWVIEPHPHPGLARGLAHGRFYVKGPGATNNVAEYHAALDALAALMALGYAGPVALLGDSQLVVNHVKGTYKCRKPELKPLLEELRRRLLLLRYRLDRARAERGGRRAIAPGLPAGD